MFDKTVDEIMNEFDHLVIENFYDVKIVYQQPEFKQIKDKYPFFVLEDGVNVDLLIAVDKEHHRVFVVSGDVLGIDSDTNKTTIDNLKVHKTPLKEYNMEKFNNRYFACVRIEGKKALVDSLGTVIWKE